METKDFEGHTPGPWHVGERKARGWSDQADFFVYAGEDHGEPNLICRPYATDAYDGIAERNANAALIAAAPRLLSVNKQLLEALRRIAALNPTLIPDDPAFFLRTAQGLANDALLAAKSSS